jgi:transcriptional regulator with XRE-family HTH domain
MRPIGETIRNARKIKGLSQERLAELCKVNLRTIQRVENNENSSRGSTLNLICEILEIDSEKLISQTNEKKKNNKIVYWFFIIFQNTASLFLFVFLTLDLSPSINAIIRVLLLSFFFPLFINYFTPKMTRTERTLKFGSGLFIHLIMEIIYGNFQTGLVNGIIPSLFIVIGTLYYGDLIIKLQKK